MSWPLTIGLAIAAVSGVIAVIKGMQWADDRFVTRREFERAITDGARTEKLLEHIEALTNAVLNRK